MVLQADYIRAGVTQVCLPADTCKSMMGKRISRMVGQALLLFLTRIYSDGNVDYTTELAGGKFDETFQEEDLQLDKLKTGVGGGQDSIHQVLSCHERISKRWGGC